VNIVSDVYVNRYSYRNSHSCDMEDSTEPTVHQIKELRSVRCSVSAVLVEVGAVRRVAVSEMTTATKVCD